MVIQVLILFTGILIFHPKCCARPTGERQTITLHSCSRDDINFFPLPTAQGCIAEDQCSACDEGLEAEDAALVDVNNGEMVCLSSSAFYGCS